MALCIRQLDMCLWNTDAPGGNKVKIWQKSLSPTFWPCPTPGACDVNEVWGTLRWTYSPSLVTVSSPNLEILHFVWKRDGITDRQTTDRQTHVHRQRANLFTVILRNGPIYSPFTTRWGYRGPILNLNPRRSMVISFSIYVTKINLLEPKK